jgi:prevent-host-death family protein
MKTVTTREMKAKLSEWLRTAQGERVLITSHGAPIAVLTGVEGRDLTDVFMEYDERLAGALKRAERGAFTPIGKVRAELGVPRRVAAAKRSRKK